LVIPASAPDKLAAAVAQLAEDAQTARAMGANGADYVVREASWRRRGDDIHHILKSALRLQKNA
jgi:glycosyltransferase involved in cell wall biosynthesis